ncbi:hypothetical protein A2U01_0064758, partial [Trifolium medium]|nr:hypothetical protein [Trifolium medium]
MIANRMTTQGERMKPVVIVEKILRSMTPKFNYVRLKSQVEKKDEQALKITGSGRGGGTRGRG